MQEGERVVPPGKLIVDHRGILLHTDVNRKTSATYIIDITFTKHRYAGMGVQNLSRECVLNVVSFLGALRYVRGCLRLRALSLSHSPGILTFSIL